MNPVTGAGIGGFPPVATRPVVAVTPNPAWDVTYTVSQLEPGEVHRVEIVRARAGGKGVNVARVARALGAESFVIAPVGGRLGAAFSEDLTLPGQLVQIAGELRQSVAITPRTAGADGGHPSVFNEPGPLMSNAEWRRLQEVVRARSASAVVTISGSMPLQSHADRVHGLIESAAPADLVYADMSGPALMWAAAAGVDLVKPNEEELAAATGESDVAAGARVLLDAGARAVIVTAGARGMTLYLPDSDRPVARARVDAEVSGNPTGAGDAALAALAVTSDWPWPDRLGFAAAVSAAAVLSPVAGEVDPSDVAHLQASIVQQTGDFS